MEYTHNEQCNMTLPSVFEQGITVWNVQVYLIPTISYVW